MLQEQRQTKIQQLVNEYGFMTIKALAERIGVADMTIRRDVTKLDSLHLLKRVYGGAKSLTKPMNEQPSSLKLQLHSTEKKEIGAKISDYVYENIQTMDKHIMVYLSAGTTTYAAAPTLPEQATYVTNNFLLFQKLLTRNLDVLLTGGHFHENTSEFIGQMAINSLQNINFDIAFLTTNGVSGQEVSTSTIEEGTIQKAVLDQSKLKILAMDDSKFNHLDTHTFATLDQFSAIMTNTKSIPEETLAGYNNRISFI
ncbi:DeoR/GlpR family DNA-binding transcription regulator [Dellaglioa sp. L3N]